MINSHKAARLAAEAGHPGVFLSFEAGQAYTSGWAVRHVQHQTDPSMIHNGGTRLYSGPRGSKALQEAMDWAGERYGVAEWVKIPGFQGDYFPKSAAAVITAARKADKAETAATQAGAAQG